MQLESLKSQQMSRIRSTGFLTGSVLVPTGVLLPLHCRTDSSLCPLFPEAKEILCIFTVYMSSVLLSSGHHEAASTSSNTCLFGFACWVKARVTVLPFTHWGCFGVELEHSPTKSTKICSSLSFYMGSPTCYSCVTANGNFNF